MGASGAVPEQEADTRGRHGRDACSVMEGKQEGRGAANAHAPSFSFLPRLLPAMLLWASVSLPAKWAESHLPCTWTGEGQWEDSVHQGPDAQHQGGASIHKYTRFTGISFSLRGASRSECMHACVLSHFSHV